MDQLPQNIRLLGDMLGNIIVKQAGEPVFELEETLRGLAKKWRDGDAAALDQIRQIIDDLVCDLPLTSDILKAFSIYFQLVNLAEEHERIRILDERANNAFAEKTAMDESIRAAIETLKREDYTADQVEEVLNQMLIMPVFTAHPTESKRRTTREILKHLSGSLHQLESGKPVEQPQIQEALFEYITLLWQSDESRNRKPTVMDEVRNTGS